MRLASRIVTLDATYSAVLTNLSLTGAQVTLAKALDPGNDVVLIWHGQEAFGEIIWSHGGSCGIKFDQHIAPDVLIATRDQTDAEPLPDDKELNRLAARSWVRGETDFGFS